MAADAPSIEERAREVVEQLQAYVKASGRDIELDRIDGDVARVRLSGGPPSFCYSDLVMMRLTIERRLLEEFPTLREVVFSGAGIGNGE
ncbi:hypothetical protein BH09SUM1_BH09SUM1_27170 [soil metagenome]